MTDSPSAGDRLERLWAGGFGDAYVERNAPALEVRGRFWQRLLDRFPTRSVLEVGVAHGANLRLLSKLVTPHDVWGVDINETALAALRTNVPDVNAVWGVARALPFRDRLFDLVFTVGLLIHIPDSTLPLVMGEIVRCSERWIFCGEYHAEDPAEVEYRGQTGVLFKRDYGRLYRELFPELTLREEGYLTAEEGFDRVTYQVFERT
ncbi:MAG: Methyltransferase type 11 [Acidimicrobiales bacterium]|nr:Methyltransferase type 11 [Acidimicrobiales bacterium]